MKFQVSPIFGKVSRLLVNELKDDFVTSPVGELKITFEGFPDERHRGNSRLSGGREKKQYPPGTRIRNNRQWSALSEEELIVIAGNMGVREIKPGWLGANIIFEGIPHFSKLPPLSHIIINPDSSDFVSLVVFEENGPCKYPNEVIARYTGKYLWNCSFMVAAKGLRGLVGWVDRPGVIRVGDRVKVLVAEV